MRLTVYADRKEPAQEKLEPAELDETIGDTELREVPTARRHSPSDLRSTVPSTYPSWTADSQNGRSERRDRVEVVRDGFVRERVNSSLHLRSLMA